MAYEFYITIEGSKQGTFKAGLDTGIEKKGGKHRIAGIKFLSEITSPRDTATGQASGKRIHKPISITKQWDAASPQIFKALVNNETLTSVLFEFVKTNPKGIEEVYHTIKLTNASVSNIRSYLDLTDTSGDPYDAHELEDVSFVFQKIEIENTEGKTSVADTWQV